MPSVRVTQEAAEILAEPDFQEARVTQEVLEVPIETSHQSARVTQEVLEVPIETSHQSARVTQLVLEVLIQNIGVVPPVPVTTAAEYCSLDITISWGASAGCDGYIIEVQIDDMTTWQRVATVDATVLSIVDTRESGHVYQYRVAAVYGATVTAYTVGQEIYLLCQRW